MTEESILEISRNVERFTNHPPGGKSGGGEGELRDGGGKRGEEREGKRGGRERGRR